MSSARRSGGERRERGSGGRSKSPDMSEQPGLRRLVQKRLLEDVFDGASGECMHVLPLQQQIQPILLLAYFVLEPEKYLIVMSAFPVVFIVAFSCRICSQRPKLEGVGRG